MTIYSQPDWPIRLLDIINHQRDLYQQLFALGSQQSDFVEVGDAEQLLKVLGQRQHLIDQLQEIGTTLKPFRDAWPATWSRLTPDVKDRITRILDDIQKLIEQIMSKDEEDRVALTQHRSDMADQLQQVGQGTALNRAYQQTGSNVINNRYADRHG